MITGDYGIEQTGNIIYLWISYGRIKSCTDKHQLRIKLEQHDIRSGVSLVQIYKHLHFRKWSFYKVL